MVSLTRATELVVAHLERTQNYPKTDEGIDALARGLKHASDSTGVGAGRIVEKCAHESKFCPTDYDLLVVAKELARGDAIAGGTFDSLAGAANVAPQATQETLKAEYGDAIPFDWHQIDHAHVKGVKDRERSLLTAIKAKYPGELNWIQMAVAARELGYEDYARTWERAMGK